MGGIGSGQYPGNANHRGGKTKKAAVAVVGTGSPLMPADLPAGVAKEWFRLDEMLRGVAFEQDSDALAELAWLTWQQMEVRRELGESPTDGDLQKQSLALGRAMNVAWNAFGMTPRSRQILLIPTNEEKELDPLEALQAGYSDV